LTKTAIYCVLAKSFEQPKYDRTCHPAIVLEAAQDTMADLKLVEYEGTWPSVSSVFSVVER
jgi:hypothetical protein